MQREKKKRDKTRFVEYSATQLKMQQQRERKRETNRPFADSALVLRTQGGNSAVEHSNNQLARI